MATSSEHLFGWFGWIGENTHGDPQRAFWDAIMHAMIGFTSRACTSARSIGSMCSAHLRTKAAIHQSAALGDFAQRNLDEALAVLRTDGHDPDDVCFAIDVDASSRFRSVMKERSPCFLRSRARGFYLSSVGRRMTIDEMAALQGFSCFGSTSVSSAALGGMLGNAMSMNIVVRVMSSVLPSIGVQVPPTFIDPWFPAQRLMLVLLPVQ